MKRKFFSISLIIILTLLLLEFFSFFAVKYKLINFTQIPKIYLNKNFVFYSNWYNEKNEWGAWRDPNKKTKHSKKCFDIEYSSNEIGARDSSFKNLKYEKYIFTW